MAVQSTAHQNYYLFVILYSLLFSSARGIRGAKHRPPKLLFIRYSLFFIIFFRPRHPARYMVLSPPPRPEKGAFRLFFQKSIILHSIKLSVPAELRTRYAALPLLSHGHEAVLLNELTIMAVQSTAHQNYYLFVILYSLLFSSGYSLFFIIFFRSGGLPPRDRILRISA